MTNLVATRVQNGLAHRPSARGTNDESQCRAVRRFLSANPNSPILQVAVATGVPRSAVEKLAQHECIPGRLLPADMNSEWSASMDSIRRSEGRMPAEPSDRTERGTRLFREGF